VLAQRQPSAMQACPDRVRIDLQNLRGLLCCQFFHVPKQHYASVELGQLLYRRRQGAVQFGVQQEVVRQARSIGDLDAAPSPVAILCGPQFVERQFRARREHAPPPLHEAFVLGDAKYPRLQAGWISKLIDALEDLQKCLLSDLLGVLPMSADQVTVLGQSGPIRIHEFIEGTFTACQQVPREFDVAF
jgi:hypothetical protein